MKNKRNQIILAVILMCIVLFIVFAFSDDKDLQKEVVQQATEMKIELIKCFEAYAYCRSYGQADFNLDPVYLLPLLESLEKQIDALQYK